MLLMQISITFLLLVFLQDTEGFEERNLNNDSESTNCNGSSQSISSIQDGVFANRSSSDNDCGEYQDDFHHELVNLTSNSQINITTDVMLLSFVSLVGLEDIAIIGYDNPTINCNNAGGIYFENCNNCIIVGVTWENCGGKNDNKPVIELHNSSDITILNCTFQHSLTQALVFSGISGNVTISNCKFAFNNESVGHGTALYYASRLIHDFKFQFNISNCNFIENGINGKSVVYISSLNNKSMELIFFTNVSFLNNQAVPIYISHQNVFADGNVLFKGNVADGSGGMFITNNSNVVLHNSYTKLINNTAMYNGGAFHIQDNSKVTFKGNNTVTIKSNKGVYGGGFYISDNSDVTFKGNSLITIGDSTSKRSGGGLSIWRNSKLRFTGNCEVTINHNSAAVHGGAIFIGDNSSITFEGNSMATVSSNEALRGGGIFIRSSNIIFEGNSSVIINYNQVRFIGGAIYLQTNSNVMCDENSVVKINKNQANFGGAIYIDLISRVKFKGNSKTTINNNQALFEGGAFCAYLSDVSFEENALVSFSNNEAVQNGGAMYFLRYCHVTFKGDTQVNFYSNSASGNGGALYGRDNCNITMKGRSVVILNNNRAMGEGGAMYINSNSAIMFQENSIIKFSNNQVSSYGGSLYLKNNCEVLFEENTQVMFYNNTADVNGGTLCAWDNCSVAIKGNSTVTCTNNNALNDGGGLYINANSAITFQDNSTVNFTDNTASSFGGALRSNSLIVFENNCRVIFNHNEATQGGAIYSMSDTVFNDNSVAQFGNNKADTSGGALYVSNLTFSGHTLVTFNDNKAILNGGAVYSRNSTITMEQKSTVMFINNSAENGGAIFSSVSTLSLTEHTNMIFDNNVAAQDGGAIHFDEYTNAAFKNTSTITLSSNTADNHGGAVYTIITQTTNFFNISIINFSNNTAGVAGNSLYIDITKSCNDSCFADRTAGIISSDKEVITSPNKVKLHNPAKCISNVSTECEKYYINNIMLGQGITINPCLLDYYNKPAEVTQFKIIGENHVNYFLQGSEYVSLSCNHTIRGISIVGNKPISSLFLNYSIFFTSYATSKCISAHVIVELSPCHPGFQYQSESKKCECYNTNEIVHCSGSSSTIKRGYWFGSVTGIPTVTFCPINYCNFTCCKTTNGYYELSPVRVNQCKSHRSGTACGSCEEGYTLSFDSPECVDVNKCTTGQTTLIVTLTVFYWFIIIIAVFIIMYYQVGIGYFYAVTYYYSVVDILLGQYTDTSNVFYHTVTIFSSIAKITPQFLGQLCLSKNISGIDQQFIHYVHPLAVSAILIMVSWLARNSKRLSVIISRGIIRALCFLLLLSYTSVVTTSLLLMRSLTFIDVDNVYTYLSPDIQYFHGRHLAYGIIAIAFTLLIVIGLPLLLLLEPFLNAKINFFKIKPILDQFQGCYKDNCRWFAAYYMICRLIIVSIIIANLSEAFISQFLLITASTIISLIHLIVRPYADDVLNMFDGAILQLMVLVTVLPLFEYFDSFDSNLVVAAAFVLIILPLVQFTVMKVFISKQTIKVITKKTIKRLSIDNRARHEDVPDSDVAGRVSPNFVKVITDDNSRGHTTSYDM